MEEVEEKRGKRGGRERGRRGVDQGMSCAVPGRVLIGLARHVLTERVPVAPCDPSPTTRGSWRARDGRERERPLECLECRSKTRGGGGGGGEWGGIGEWRGIGGGGGGQSPDASQKSTVHIAEAVRVQDGACHGGMRQIQAQHQCVQIAILRPLSRVFEVSQHEMRRPAGIARIASISIPLGGR